VSVRTPRGELVRTVAAVVALAGAALAHSSYTVRPGDTLSEIAVRLGSSVRGLAEANHIRDPDRIEAGEVLTVPGSGRRGRDHVVRPGESLSAIAARYGVGVADLAAANGITEPDRIWAGWRLLVDAPPAPSLASGPATHLVRWGETLSGIAAAHRVTQAELAADNGIDDPDRLPAGTRLSIARWHCPVRGPVSFVNDFGAPRDGGRFHDGVDLFAPRGAPVVANVAGRVERFQGSRGGRQYRLRGDDGNVYVGTHLDAYAAAGRVRAGTVIGSVGTTGNADGTPPHLHFQVHPSGGAAANPYPMLREAC
jgi:murein DD-endopeptidase MepM/ murein hydrolase activator NlpD